MTVADRERTPSQASQLVALARETYDLFMSVDGRPYGVVKGGANIALPLRGRAGLRSQLAHRYTDAHDGAVPATSAMADAMLVLEGLAATADPRAPHLRVAGLDSEVVVDLADPGGRCVVVGPDGWRLEPRSPVLFRRSGAMLSLPAPARAGDGLAMLRDLLNTDDAGFRLLVGWLVAAFMPELPHPILAFRGEQGTGKSTAAEMVIRLVDPSGAPKRTAPRDIRSWATQCFNSWALCLDNVSTVPPWLSDAMCRAVTGDGVIDRALYTDDDVVVQEFRRVLAITTIDAGALAGDLAERLLTIELHTIPDRRRREEKDLVAAYRAAHPAILASLFDLLSDVLKVMPDVVLAERPRMADFARVLAAVDTVTGWSTLETYRASTRDAVSDVLEGDPFAGAVITLVDQAGPDGLTLTAKQLLERIPTPDPLPKSWPKDATRAGGALKRLAPALREVGIEVDDSGRGPKPKRARLYRLTASPERRRETAVPASTSDQNRAPTSGNRVDAGSVASASTHADESGKGDAGLLRVDAAAAASVHSPRVADLRERSRGDTGDAGDTSSRVPSGVVVIDGSRPSHA